MGQHRRRRIGFSLIEILLAVALMTAFSAMAVLQFKRSQSRAGAQGLAQILSEEFRRVRQEAIARRRPTALVLPTNNATSSKCRSFYVMDGEILPRITRSRSFNSEFNGADIFVGTWPTISGGFQDSPTTNTMVGSKWPTFTVDNWLPASAQARADYCFVFLPDGTLHTNAMKTYDGRYHVVVSAGAQAPAGRLQQLQSSGEAYTISLSPVGGVSISSGIFGQNGSIQARGRTGTDIGFSAPKAGPVDAETPAPLNQYPMIFPEPSQANASSPPPTLITKDQYVTLEMRAKSSSGEQLFCQWQVVNAPPDKVSAFSIQSDVAAEPGKSGGRMEWDQSLNGGVGAWKAIWQWRPPVDALPGENYSLQCLVQNVDGGKKTVAIKEFQIERPSRIIYERIEGGDHQIWTMGESGERDRAYLPNGRYPSATLNASRIAYVSKANNQIYLHSPTDPSQDIQLTDNGHQLACPAISPNGNFVAFVDKSEGNKVKVMRAGRNAPAQDLGLSIGPNAPTYFEHDIYKLGWSADGRYLLVPQASNIAVRSWNGSNWVAAGTIGNLMGGGNGPLSAATCLGQTGASVNELDVLWVDNFNSTSGTFSHPYDPWVLRSHNGHTDNAYLSISFEDTQVERCPGNRSRALMVRGAAGTGADRQIHTLDLAAPAASIVGPAIRQQPGVQRIRPVWTE